MPSDEQGLQDVIKAFEQIPGLRSSRIFIDVKSRLVTIRGHVHSVAQRHDAERIARGIVGLRARVLEVGISVR
jgi:osmotically-inducible protein OsmY